MGRKRLQSVLNFIQMLRNNPDLTSSELYQQLQSVYKTGYQIGRKKTDLVKRQNTPATPVAKGKK